MKSFKNILILSLIAFILLIAVFICGNNCHWKNFELLNAIFSGLAFIGIISTLYLQFINMKNSQKIQHILLQISINMKWMEFFKGNAEYEAEILENIIILEEELKKISGFDPDFVYYQKMKNIKKSKIT